MSSSAEKFAVLADVLAWGAREGALPGEVGIDLTAHALIGPLVFAVLSDREEIVDVVGVTVDRFLASYR